MVDTLGIGSMAPGALLFEASRGYQVSLTILFFAVFSKIIIALMLRNYLHNL